MGVRTRRCSGRRAPCYGAKAISPQERTNSMCAYGATNAKNIAVIVNEQRIKEGKTTVTRGKFCRGFLGCRRHHHPMECPLRSFALFIKNCVSCSQVLPPIEPGTTIRARQAWYKSAVDGIANNTDWQCVKHTRSPLFINSVLIFLREDTWRASITRK